MADFSTNAKTGIISDLNRCGNRSEYCLTGWIILTGATPFPEAARP
jgi:hypothetical protein